MFTQDLKTSQAIVEELKNQIWWNIINWYCKDWDLLLEVKTDYKCKDTWNVAFETKFNWKDSWIYASKSKFIMYNVANKYWSCDRVKLINYIENQLESKNPKYKIVNAWDYASSEIVLIPLYDFIGLFNEIKF